jgi:hypothetical protein
MLVEPRGGVCGRPRDGYFGKMGPAVEIGILGKVRACGWVILERGATVEMGNFEIVNPPWSLVNGKGCRRGIW